MRSMIRRIPKAILASGVLLLQILACAKAESPDATGPGGTTPDPGGSSSSASISITVKVTGALSSDRFLIEIDGRSMTLLATEVSLVVKDLYAGSHTVLLLGLPKGCEVEGANPITIDVPASRVSSVHFDVDCVPETPAVPPGDRLAGTLAFVSTREGAPHIYLANPDGTNVRRLTHQAVGEFAPVWSPDGQRLAFNTDSGTWVIERDGSGLRRLRAGGWSPSWSPDGKRLLVGSGDVGFTIIPVEDDGAPLVHIQIDQTVVDMARIAGVTESAWSPDGTRIAFTAWTGMDFIELFVMNVDGSHVRRIVEGQRQWDECGPRWSRDGTRIAVLSMALRAAATVPVDGGQLVPLFAPGTSCWDTNVGGEQSQSGIGWSPDGNAMAVTMRTPSWEPSARWPQSQQASIAIVDVASRAQLALIPDAYDPAWTR